MLEWVVSALSFIVLRSYNVCTIMDLSVIMEDSV